ncbi:zinc-dependent metalloprotease [Propionicicella superfundia]|uniref:zinc-dependent metalloprotease n=1 Tax=Propionicicella superfundia TaxID=348582 RepID=UPI000559D237|nr:zinc-dependent metalloprotease [Propionicicella superfundia]
MSPLPELDWGLAARIGGRVVPAGPVVPLAQATAAVDGLRVAADRAAEVIAERSGLRNPGRVPVVVVDRPGWIAANAAMAEGLMRDILPGARSPRVVARTVGVQAGAVLAVVSTRILGQFEGLSPDPRLLLVAPNVVGFERASGVATGDFRLWVCLHEQTHQFQFSHAPWLAGHLRGLAADLLGTDDASRSEDAFEVLSAAMTFLEGHAEVQMDITAVGLVRSLSRLRRSLDGRRRSPGLFGLVQRAIGLGHKVSQYERGAAFCRYLHERGGLDLLNRPLAGPDALPAPDEIEEPDRWLRRVG